MATFRGARGLRRACLLIGCVVWTGLAGATTLQPPWLRALETVALDDPRAALSEAQQRLQTAREPEARFWALLGLIDVQDKLELDAAEAATLVQATETLAGWPGAAPGHRLWLDYARLQATWRAQPLEAMKALLQDTRRALAARPDSALACALTDVESGLLLAVDSFDEAWLAAEALERCGREIGSIDRHATALKRFGIIAGRGHGAGQTDPDDYFQRALAALGPTPGRWMVSIIVWDQGNAARRLKRWDAALALFTQAREISRQIGDRAGLASAANAMAELHLERHEPALALPLLREAEPVFREQDDGYRLAPLATWTIQAMARLKRDDVIDAIARARRWDVPAQPALVRSRLARAMAEGYASQGRFAEAYAEVVRSEALGQDARRVAADVQTLRLQARYENAKREAETAELRHRGESAQLALAAETATRRALLSVLALMAIVLLGLAAWAWRAWAQRRAMADLALRDELTGQPNRRAVTAYAQAQFDLARRLGVALTVAVIDLDHFKRVNDRYGHATGDQVLRALAGTANAVLRGHDQLGRWGGEEWLLVTPGLSLGDLPPLFERLRQRFVATPVAGVPAPHGFSFSMGAAELGPDTPSLDALIAEADAALYRAKAEGRDRLCCGG